MLEYFLETFLEAVNVIVDEVLLVNLGLVYQADQGQAFVDFSQVEYNVLLVVSVSQSDDA